VLKDKIPQAITNMCVVLLGNDRTALAELEASVQMITQRLNTWNARERTAAIKELEARLEALRVQAGEIDKNLRAVRESDTFSHPEMPGGYSGTLQNVAQVLHDQQPALGWIASFAQGLDIEKLPESPTLFNEEAAELLQGLRAVDADRRRELQRELPPVDAMVPAGELERMVTDEQQAAAVASQARAGMSADQPKLLPDDLDVDETTVQELCELLDRIVRMNAEMENHHLAWVPRLARDIRCGQYEPWRVLLDQSQTKINAIRRHPDQISELEVIGMGDIDITTVHNDVELICKHV